MYVLYNVYNTAGPQITKISHSVDIIVLIKKAYAIQPHIMWLFRLVTTIISQFVKDEKQGNAEQNALAMGHFFIPELYHFQFTSMDLT